MTRHTLHRRQFLRWGAAGAGAVAVSPWPSRARGESAPKASFLFVVTAAGGGSIIDSVLPVAQSEVSSPDIAARLPVYPDMALAQPPGSNIRCVTNISGQLAGQPFLHSYDPVGFVARHHNDMLVMTVENSSVSHPEAQKRSMTGDSFDRGRTITEAMAMVYGQDQPLPNVVMSGGGFAEHGLWPEVPERARGVFIDSAKWFALSTDRHKGIAHAPRQSAFAQATQVRRRLEERSLFGERYQNNASRRRFLDLRRGPSADIEAAGLIDKLLLTAGNTSEEGGLQASPDLAHLREKLPKIDQDPLHAQAALAFLLARFNVSSAMTFGTGGIPELSDDGTLPGTPLDFDFSHTSHIIGQNVNWCRLLEPIDGLIALLKEEPYQDGSMWDRSLIYVATDFGRSRDIPEGGSVFNYPSGHDLNNGNLFISPLLRGNRVYGGVDPDTCLTYGFDPTTGDPEPGRQMNAGHLYSLVAQALGIDFPGRYDMSALVR